MRGLRRGAVTETSELTRGSSSGRALEPGAVASRRWRVAAVASHPIQYQAPWFRALACKVDLEVFFCHRQDATGQAAAGFETEFEWDVPLLEGYHYRWLENRARRPNVFSYKGCDTPRIDATLAAGRFDACIVQGWYLKSYRQAIRACRANGIPVLVRSDSQLRTPRSWVKRAAKWLPYRLLLNAVDAHLYVGHANKAYLEHYAVPDRKLFFVPHFVDNAFFADRAERARRLGDARQIRSRFAIPAESTLALFVGRLVPQKRPADFVAALARVQRDARCPIRGLVVGSGELSGELRTLAGVAQAPVSFAGFRNQTELPAFYAAADALVLPSDGRETWGLVVNEAMACGLPVVVSREVGCAPDLVIDGETGWSFPVGDVDALAGCLAQLADRLAHGGKEIHEAVRSRIARYDSGAAVAGTLAAVSAVAVTRST